METVGAGRPEKAKQVESSEPPNTVGKDDQSESLIKREPPVSKNVQKWLIRIGVLVIIGLVVLIVVWLIQRPAKVDLIQPKQATIAETITSSGRVGGTTETNVGSQSQGIIEKLFVGEGDDVVGGQQLALIKNDVAEAQYLQARSAVDTARSQLMQVSRGGLASEIDAATELVKQAKAQVEQQRVAIIQAQKNVAQTHSQLAQVEAERDLAKTNLERNEKLVRSGDISRAQYDQALTNSRVADKRVEVQDRAIELAESSVNSAQANLRSAQANVGIQEARLRTIQTGARPEDVRVAEQRVAETERALSVAQQQAGNASVYAPFAGKVTKILTQTGQSVGPQGVLTLVSVSPEIRLDVDESNLSSLRVGQEAVISSGAFSGSSFEGNVSELGAAVDRTRGTIEIKVVPNSTPEWLRPGQTVDVNIITAKNVNRLLVPENALIRVGDETVIFMIENGKIVKKAVVSRPPTSEGVPIISGLEPQDWIIANAAKVEVGDRVRSN
ncbi:MAG: efflux RND transporter periplasmic adaptor subunit [Pyrinomonadaceae bacterium]